MHLPLGFFGLGARVFMKFPLRVAKNIPKMRTYFDTVAKYSSPPVKGTRFKTIKLGSSKVSAVAVNDPTAQIVLYIHGGGFVFGSADAYKGFVSKISARLGLQVVIPDYALAPERAFPAGFDDVLNCYMALLDQGYLGKDIALMGDSAGGNLILACLSEILKRGLELPACTVALASQTDFTLQGASMIKNRKTDCVLPSDRYHDLRASYLGDTEPTDTRASPLFANFNGATPVQIQVAKHEILYDDNIAMAAKLRSDGVDVDLHEFDHGFHVFQLLAGRLAAADAALDTATDFITAHLQGKAKI
jgi:acetyl esterase/lipase